MFPRRFAHAIVWSAWTLFVVSFFLPATNIVELRETPRGTPLNGWEAMWASISGIGAAPLLLFVEPRVLIFFVLPWVNLAMLLAPLCLRERESPILIRLSGIILGVSAIFPWLPATPDRDIVFWILRLEWLVPFDGIWTRNV